MGLIQATAYVRLEVAHDTLRLCVRVDDDVHVRTADMCRQETPTAILADLTNSG
jgi:hypothetical protein